MTDELNSNEIHKLRQLICEHTETFDNNYGCSCCGNFDQMCRKCDLEIDHECNDHDTDDGYCGRCR